MSLLQHHPQGRGDDSDVEVFREHNRLPVDVDDGGSGTMYSDVLGLDFGEVT